MKRLLACLALCASLSASAQDVYPYNPDIEPDGYIGINDLLALLPIFGQEFEVVTVDSDTSSALVFTGSLPYLQCRQSCKSLGPSWNVADEEDVVLHLDSLLDDQTFGAWGFMWMMSNTTNHTRLAVRTRVNVIGNLHFLGEITSKGTDYNCDCWCAAKVRPEIEYSVCSDPNMPTVLGDATWPSFQLCVDSKISDGWLPLGGLTIDEDQPKQAFWRYAE